ncbi:hypothetical protein [Archaeoglobus profundus]|uniref:Uncharacterized protein n=1 Tax=Archaeoglobus profundus (strain DSM 5631 / JCM 9629 / NBRC 100127 / Av18) TaxID=572546 RepID=D2RGS3_ARCPA|nr:hypothetical protein [Archaeoglobus profundus]ADB57498.1 hypothetical protein Arcpr_0430 [Archaeoglobus profundus DSM 5631]
MIGDKALKVVSDFVLRKVPEGLFEVRTFCACSDYRRLDVKTPEEIVKVLNEVFERFGSLIEDWEVEAIKPWLRPYGIIIEKEDRYRAKLLKTGYEDKLDELLDYYSCGMKRESLVLAKALLDSIAKERGFESFKDMVKGKLADLLELFYDSLDRDLNDEEILFLLKTMRNVLELCSSQRV